MKKQELNVWLIRPIKTIENTELVIKEVFYFFIVVAIIQILIGLLLPSLLIDGLIFIILALLLKFTKSRIAAVLLLIMSLMAFSTTFMNKFGITDAGGSNIYLAFVVVIGGIQAVRATFRYHKLK